MRKRAEHIHRIGLIGNTGKPECADIVRRAARLVARAGRQPLRQPDAAALARDTDLLLVFGGDGTMLRAARDTAGSATPILGVNIGGLGFLTAVPSHGLARALNLVWQGRFKYESHDLIEVSGRCQGRRIHETALNDIVVSRGAVSRLIRLDVSVDGEPITRYYGDGLIISSPTGSTAYSLAAGGPIVLPSADVFALTPICPHTLSNRPLIVPLGSSIRVKAATSPPSTIVSADGQFVAALDPGDEVTVRRSRQTVRLIHLADSSFMEALRQKLHWRGTNL